MATIDTDSGHGRSGRRVVNHHLPLVPFIDFLVCLIVFLLAEVGFANIARLQSSALARGNEMSATAAESTRLHVDVQEDRFRITWRTGATVIASDELPSHVVIERGGERHYPELARFLERSFLSHGTHQDPGDPRLDEAVLHVRNSAAYEDVIAVLDALHAPRRELPWAKQGSVFAVSFAAD